MKYDRLLHPRSLYQSRWLIGSLLTMALLVAIGCQQEHLPDPTLETGHPANASLQTSPMPESGSIFDLKPGQATAPPSASNMASDSSMKMVYVCPMHEQIRMDAPGKCPLCNMTLKVEHVSTGKSEHEGH